MSTTAPQPYRHHTRLPEWVNPATSGKPGAKRSYLGVDELAFRGARTTSPAARALTAEWPLTNTAHRDEVRGWTQTEPALRGLGSGGEILDAIDTLACRDAAKMSQRALVLIYGDPNSVARPFGGSAPAMSSSFTTNARCRARSACSAR